MLVIVDLGMGNLQSVANALHRVGARARVTQWSRDIEQADAVILPGVGAFGDGMANLRQRGLIESLREHALDRKKPLLGICLGMQLLAHEGEEHGHWKGLGFLAGRVARLQVTHPACRIPNMGWCDLTVQNRTSPLFGHIADGEPFYFAHSYYFQCADPGVVAATIDYGGPITAAVEQGNIFGVQFHPEKSQDAGLDLLEAFVHLVGASCAKEKG